MEADRFRLKIGRDQHLAPNDGLELNERSG